MHKSGNLIDGVGVGTEESTEEVDVCVFLRLGAFLVLVGF